MPVFRILQRRFPGRDREARTAASEIIDLFDADLKELEEMKQAYNEPPRSSSSNSRLLRALRAREALNDTLRRTTASRKQYDQWQAEALWSEYPNLSELLEPAEEEQS